jgi:hypothetical protein
MKQAATLLAIATSTMRCLVEEKIVPASQVVAKIDTPEKFSACEMRDGKPNLVTFLQELQAIAIR